MGQLFFTNLVGSIHQSYIQDPKTFTQHVLGTFAVFDDHCLWLAESRALLWMKNLMGQRFFANLVGIIRWSYIQGPKSFAQHVLGTFTLFDDYCLGLADWWRAEFSCGWNLKRKEKRMMVLLGSSLTSEGICLFVDLWEAQPCLGMRQ